jgi:hypothetical protein
VKLVASKISLRKDLLLEQLSQGHGQMAKKLLSTPKVAVRCLLRKPKKKRQRLNQPLNQPLVNLQQPLPLDPIVVLKTKATLAKKQLVKRRQDS